MATWNMQVNGESLSVRKATTDKFGWVVIVEVGELRLYLTADDVQALRSGLSMALEDGDASPAATEL
jgi:hypothetical protein